MRRLAREALAACRLAGANFARLDSPLKVNLCVTYRCQSRCKTCGIWQRRPAGELSTDELLRFVASNRSVAWLDVMGGEVFLREDVGELFDAIASSWKKLAILHFATNGLLTDGIVSATRRLVGRTPAEVIVTVSVDGDQGLNDEIRGVPGGFRKQMETFNALRRVPGARVVLGMTVSRHNVGRVEEAFAACSRAAPGLRLEDFHLNVAQRSSHYYDNEEIAQLRAPTEELRRELGRYRRKRERPFTPSAWVESRYLRHLDHFLASGSTPVRCHALRSSCFIDPSGTVYPCIGFARPLGSLRDSRMCLEPIWRADASRELQREIWEGHCPQCWTPCEAYQSILGNVLRMEPAR